MNKKLDKDLLHEAVKLTETQLLANSLSCVGNQTRDMDFVDESSVMDMVYSYYKALEKRVIN